MDSTIHNPSIPYVGPLPCPLQPGHLIRTSGAVANSATCFSINLQTSSNGSQRNDIALHLSPVFSPPPRLVRNSLENQKWGPEESHGPYFPFSCGQDFEILILVETDHFKVAVNGQHFTEYHYRLPLYAVSHLAIDGDVTINLIKFEGVPKSPMDSGSGESISKPLGFVIEPNSQQNLSLATASDRPSSFGYPTSFGPSPTTPYGPPVSNPQGPGPYGPSPTYIPHGPLPQGNIYPSGRVSPSPYPPGASSPYGPPPGATSPYGPPPGATSPYGPPSGTTSPYGPPPGATSPYGPQPGGSSPYPQAHQGYPQQPGAYPSQGMYPSSNPYPSQPGPYPGTTVVYPDQGKNKSDSGYLGPLAAAGAAALAGAAGSALMGGKHKKSKHSHGIPGMLGGHAGPASLIGGVGSLLSGGGKHGKHSGSSPIPIGGAVAGGAAALAGAYMLSKSPMGKVMKPKKLKKLYKHKHKGGWGGFGSSSSSSSDEE